MNQSPPAYHRRHLKLQYSVCSACRSTSFPPSKICVKCFSNKLKRANIVPLGRVVSLSQIHSATSYFSSTTPYTVAIIKLDKTKYQTVGQIINSDQGKVKIGSRVVGVYRQLFPPSDDGLVFYGLKWSLQSTEKL